ncbi:hypothetical protein AB3X96_30595 [Paraburkholderia sp. BR13439]|uniref:hypothetical protein n=1 Tax=Paraburkholderia TaxID=1822464 RepID=UPI0034CE66D2
MQQSTVESPFEPLAEFVARHEEIGSYSDGGLVQAAVDEFQLCDPATGKSPSAIGPVAPPMRSSVNLRT